MFFYAAKLKFNFFYACDDIQYALSIHRSFVLKVRSGLTLMNFMSQCRPGKLFGK